MHKHTHPRSRFFPFLRGGVIIFCAYSFMRRFTNAFPSNAQISSNPQASSSLCASSNAQSTVAAWCESEAIVTRAFRLLSCSNIHREGYGVVRQPRLMAPVLTSKTLPAETSASIAFSAAAECYFAQLRRVVSGLSSTVG